MSRWGMLDNTLVLDLQGLLGSREFLRKRKTAHNRTGIVTYIYQQKSTIHVGKYTIPMDPMGTQEWFQIHPPKTNILDLFLFVIFHLFTVVKSPFFTTPDAQCMVYLPIFTS